MRYILNLSIPFPFLFSTHPSCSLKEDASFLPFHEQPNVVFENEELFKKRHANLVYLPRPLFDSEKLFDQAVQLTTRAKTKDLIPAERIWMGIYFDKEIDQAIHPKVSIRFIDEEIGFGAFAGQRIAPCSFVGEYTGKVIQWKKKLLKEKFHAIRYAIWGFRRQKFLIDGEMMGNFTRCINHSATPNLCLRSVYWKGIPRLIFIALQEIVAGTQLTFDYGPLFWKKHPSLPRTLAV
ncbi:MAG: SET domain-containing protein-lysine N-methyltransferase [Chlamydiia bacterium]|nr:SET domain-containing protein-lysine N-methyltransferase [Chlamydiia bacterium]